MYTEDQLKNLISQVEQEFTAHLAKKEEEFLGKSEDSDKPKEEPKDEKSKAPSESKEEPSDQEAPAQEAAPSEESPAAEAPAVSDAPAVENEGGYGPEEVAELEEMYASMSSAELMAHHDAVKMALDAKAAQSAPAEAAPAAEASEQPAPAPEAPMAESMGMAKSEGSELALLKTELDAQKAKTEEFKKNFEAVAEFLVKSVAKKVAPAAKAITNVETIAKSEGSTEVQEVSKSKKEITEILKKKSAEQTLQKSDRELINAYYLNGASINSIAHLLK